MYVALYRFHIIECAHTFKSYFKNLKPLFVYRVFYKLFKSGSTADSGVKQIKLPFEGVMIGEKVIDKHGIDLNNLKCLFPLNLLCTHFLST